MTSVEVEPIVTGRLPLPALYAHRGSPLQHIRAVCLAYVLRHPTAGTLLVDTGFHADAVDRRRDFGVAMAFLFASLKPERFDRQLLDRGIEAPSVATVLMTHLHVDHTSGMRLLENARFWISAREWEAARAPRATFKGYVEHHLPPSDRVELVDPGRGDIDVLGDGSVRLLDTPGHTPGHMSVLVRTASGEVLLAGDAAYTLHNVRAQALPLMSADARAYRRSLARLAALAGEGAVVVPSHDPDAYLSL